MISPRLTLVTIAVAGVAAFAGGCGGSGKPAYCDSVSTLQKSVTSLTSSLNLNEGISGLVTQLQKIESDGTLKKIQSQAQTVVSQAKSQYSSQTTAIKTSFDKLANDVEALSSSPTTTELAALATEGQTAVSAVSTLAHDVKGACK